METKTTDTPGLSSAVGVNGKTWTTIKTDAIDDARRAKENWIYK